MRKMQEKCRTSFDSKELKKKKGEISLVERMDWLQVICGRFFGMKVKNLSKREEQNPCQQRCSFAVDFFLSGSSFYSSSSFFFSTKIFCEFPIVPDPRGNHKV